MTNKAECPRRSHCAVYLDNCVIVFGGVGKLQAMSTCVIWMYNLYTEEWRKQVIAKQSDAPEPFLSAVAAAIDGTIYTFGGLLAESYNERNALWTLSKRSKGCFTWRFIKSRCNKESPSPRNGHTGWENGGNLWIFGGMGRSQEGYLNDHGDILDQVYNCNNQLLCYNPNTAKWTNPRCFGAVPSPRLYHASTNIKNKVWLFGGSENIEYFNDIFELTMHSLTWTQIHTGRPCPQARASCTLTVITDDQLVLHGGERNRKAFGDTWLMNLKSQTWRKYTRKDHVLCQNTGSSGLNNSVIIFGGMSYVNNTYQVHNIFHVMLEQSVCDSWPCMSYISTWMKYLGNFSM